MEDGVVKNPSKSKTQNKTAPADGRTVDKTAWLRYSIDIKGTTSRSVPRSDYREVTENVGVSGYFSLLFTWITREMIVVIKMQNSNNSLHVTTTITPFV